MKALIYLIMAFCTGDTDFRIGCLSNALVIGIVLLFFYILGASKLA